MEKADKLRIPELLAPAGSPDALNAAVCGGADAVYLGLENFNARRGAENFSLNNLKTYVNYCHLRQVKVYVTTNTIVITRELEEVFNLIKKAADVGVDAFIVQDLGIVKAIEKSFGKDYVHISTQTNIHNLAGVRAMHLLGAKRITLARELSLGEIEKISQLAHELGLEIECFAHGALCVCYSGQCLLSSMIGARSANRGLCAQACRLPYELISGFYKNEKKSKKRTESHLLSPKDLCTIENISDFIKIGVDSLKIEGRMKSPEYVFDVTRTYREVIDAVREMDAKEVTKEQRERLSASFSRGFTNGYLFGERGNDLMSYDRPNNRGVFIGRVKKKRLYGDSEAELEVEAETEVNFGDLIGIWTKRGQTLIKVDKVSNCKENRIIVRTKENCKDVRDKDRVFRLKRGDNGFRSDFLSPKIPVDANIKMKIGNPFEITVKSLKNDTSVTVFGDLIEKAKTKPITEKEVEEHFNRLGQTDFEVIAITCEIDEGVGIGFSSIHRLRARALSELKDNILKSIETPDFEAKNKTKTVESFKFVQNDKTNRKVKHPKLCVIVTNPTLARIAKKTGAQVFVSAKNLKKGFAERCGCLVETPEQANYPKDITIMMPFINHDTSGKSREKLTGINFNSFFEKESRFYCEDVASVFDLRSTRKTFEIGQFLPVTNEASIDLVNRISPVAVWLSPELNLSQIRQITKNLDCEAGVFAFGKQRLMTCEHCILMSEGSCNENCKECKRRKFPYYLRDRKDFDFRVVSDCFGRSVIYNSVDTDLSPNLLELIDAGVNKFMIDATFLDEETLAGTLNRFSEALKHPPKRRLPGTTSGHLFRGV